MTDIDDGVVGTRCPEPASIAVRFKGGRKVYLLCPDCKSAWRRNGSLVAAPDYELRAGELCGVLRGGEVLRRMKVMSRMLPVDVWNPPAREPLRSRWQAIKDMLFKR